MCDYSIIASKSRPARVADKLTTHQFVSSTGFKAADEIDTAVCLLPGTELAFDENVKLRGCATTYPFNTAIFRQGHKDQARMHHDMLEFADGRQVLLTHLELGQTATVLQLPAAPKNNAEKAEQTRAEFVG